MAAMTISRGLLTWRRAAGLRLVAQNSFRPPDPVGLHTMIARPAPRGTPETVFDSDTVVAAVKRLAGPYRLGAPGAPAARPHRTAGATTAPGRE
jgi:hypothetical protein